MRKKIYKTIEELQKDLDDWIYKYNYEITGEDKILAEEPRCKISLMKRRSEKNRILSYFVQEDDDEHETHKTTTAMYRLDRYVI